MTDAAGRFDTDPSRAVIDALVSGLFALSLALGRAGVLGRDDVGEVLDAMLDKIRGADLPQAERDLIVARIDQAWQHTARREMH